MEELKKALDKIYDIVLDVQNQNELLTALYEAQETTIKTLENNINEQEKELERIKKSIILSTDNASRAGRKPLTDEEIDFIRELRAKGKTQREVAEYMGIGNGTVAKYDKKDAEEKKETQVSRSSVFSS